MKLSPEMNVSDEKSAIRRRVSFADDKGFQLEKILIVNEPPDVPPILRSPIVRELLEKEINNNTVNAFWSPMFKPPPTDYLAFRKKLEQQNVCLENVSVTQDILRIAGSVKVKRLPSTDTVFIRYTTDSWVSYTDEHCKFAPYLSCVGLPENIDTFEFSIKLQSPKLVAGTVFEFCICYKTSENEYWDNNNLQNFKLALQNAQLKTSFESTLAQLASCDAYSMNSLESQFLNWCSFATESVYW